MKTTVDYITKLANIPSPTGYTSHIMNYVIAELEVSATLLSAQIKVALWSLSLVKMTANTAWSQLTLIPLVPWFVLSNQMAALKWTLSVALSTTLSKVKIVLSTLPKMVKKISGTILMHQTSVHVYKDAGTAETQSS